MKLLNTKFYSIKDSITTTDTKCFHVKLNANHIIFDGHFPNNPITPGVVQIDLVKEVLKLTLDADLQLIKMSNCKFMSILNPNTTPEVEVSFKITELEGNEIKLVGNIKDKEQIYLKISAIYLKK